MKFINFKSEDGKVETVEAFGDYVKGNLDKRTRRKMLAEYQLISPNYYASQRGSKAYYESLKNK